MTRIGTFVQLEPQVDYDAEICGMPDGNGGILLAVFNKPSSGIVQAWTPTILGLPVSKPHKSNPLGFPT